MMSYALAMSQRIAEMKELTEAVRKLYYAGHWTCPFVDEETADLLWKAVRDAAGFEVGGTE